MSILRALTILGLVFLLALVIRVGQEEERCLEKIAAAESRSEKAVLLAEAARWTLPFGNQRAEYLERALTHANELKTASPDAARGIAEEVRASIYAVRVGYLGHEDIMKRANTLIVELLAARDGLSDSEKKALAKTYDRFDGPDPWASAGSSFGFLLWLVGVWISARGGRKRGVQGLVLAAFGLTLFLGFFALA